MESAKLEEVDKSKRKQPRNKHSNFLITINTNQRFDEPNGAEYMNYESKLEQIYNELKDPNKIWDYVDFKAKGDNKDKVKFVEYCGGIEIAPVTNTLHIHIYIKFFHRSRIALKHTELSKLAEQVLGITPYVHIRGSGDASSNFQEYVMKYYNSYNNQKK